MLTLLISECSGTYWQTGSAIRGLTSPGCRLPPCLLAAAVLGGIGAPVGCSAVLSSAVISSTCFSNGVTVISAVLVSYEPVCARFRLGCTPRSQKRSLSILFLSFLSVILLEVLLAAQTRAPFLSLIFLQPARIHVA